MKVLKENVSSKEFVGLAPYLKEDKDQSFRYSIMLNDLEFTTPGRESQYIECREMVNLLRQKPNLFSARVVRERNGYVCKGNYFGEDIKTKHCTTVRESVETLLNTLSS